MQRALAGESSSGAIEVSGLTFDAWSVPLLDERDKVAGVTGVVVEITERRRLETELSNASKLEAIGRLAGGIAHDFNNNLTAIMGYVELLRARVGVPEASLRELSEVQGAAERAAGLVRRLLALGGRQALHLRSLDLAAVISKVTPALERLIGERGRLQIALPPDLLPVIGDAEALEQVIVNLALNARDAMPTGGTLTIEGANSPTAPQNRHPMMAPGPQVLLTVRDTGTGMDARTRDQVFEPFFTTKPVGEGAGLGLSIVYGIVKQLNGFIWVESELGSGSAVYMSFPAATEPAMEVTAASSPAPPTSASRGTILLVEDEPVVRRFAKRALELHGFRVIDAGSPEEALALAKPEQSISLLLTDVVMPRMNGRELADRLKAARPDMPVLYMSGYPAGLVQQEGLDPSMRFISKPFKSADLIATITEILGRP